MSAQLSNCESVNKKWQDLDLPNKIHKNNKVTNAQGKRKRSPPKKQHASETTKFNRGRT